MSIHFEQSAYREKLLEYLFVGEVLRCLWRQDETTAELLRPEVDNGGYDLVIGCHSVVRHIQLKSSRKGSSVRPQKLHLSLAEKPSGCVVWMFFDGGSLELGPFLWFGGSPGEPLPDISKFPVGKHTKANAQGIKTERPNIRELQSRECEKVHSVDALVK